MFIGDAPLPGAVVSLTAPELSRAVVTNHEGRYIFYAIPNGAYELTVVMPGMNTAKRVIAVVDGTNTLAPEQIDVNVQEELTVVTCGGYRVVDEKLLRIASEYPRLTTLGSKVTEDLEAWCLERRLDPMEILAVAQHLRALADE